MFPKNRNIAFKFTKKEQFPILKKIFKSLLTDEQYVTWLSINSEKLSLLENYYIDGFWLYFITFKFETPFGHDTVESLERPDLYYKDYNYLIINDVQKYLRKNKLNRIIKYY